MTTKIPVELSSTPGIVDGSNATAITIDSSENSTFAGNVKSPRYILDGTDSATTRYIFTDNTNTGDGRLIIQSGGGSGGYGGAINLYSHAHASKPGDVVAGISSGSSGSFRVNTTGVDTGSDVFIVKANGNVGIGITPENAYTSYTALEISRSGSIYANNSADDLNIGTNFYLDSSGNWKAKNTETATLMQYDNGAVNIYTAASTTADNNISWNHKISFPNLGGIAFNGDTAAANSLDDYEEGTWSPQLVGSSGSAGTYAQSATTAVYTKIGNRVFFNCTFYVTNKGSYSGTSVITGLPFTNNGNTTAVSTGSFPDSGYGTTSGNVLIVGQVESSGTRIIFYEGSRLDAQHAYADVGTGYYVNVAGNYMTNS